MNVNKISKENAKKWLELWLGQPVSVDSIPAHMLAAGDGQIIAIGGLRLAEGPMAILDSLATNPEIEGPLRHAAIDALVDEIVEVASDLGFKSLCAWSTDPSVLGRSFRHGFKLLHDAMIFKEL